MITQASETRSISARGPLHANLEALAAVDAPALEGVRPFVSEAPKAAGLPPPAAVPDRPVVAPGASVRVASLIAAMRGSDSSFRPRVDVVEPDPAAAAELLAQHDLAEAIAGGWLRWSVGPNAAARFAERLADEPLDAMAPALLRPESSALLPVAQELEQTLAERSTAQTERLALLLSQLRQTYADRDAAWWRARLASGLSGGEPLRAIVPTFRHAHFVHASARDLLGAWERAGHSGRLLLEGDDFSRLTALSWAEAIAQVEPDVILAINYRRDVAPETAALPIPWVCWVQDPMPHLLTPPKTPAGPLDCVIGHGYPELFAHDESQRARFAPTPVVVEPRRFERAGARVDERTCEIAYVSNQSEPPEAMAMRLARGLTGVPFDGVRFVETIAASIPELRDGFAKDGADAGALFDRFIRGALGPAGDRAPSGLVTMLRTQIAEPLLERTLRHEAVGWAAGICARRGWRLALHGRGWERVERFAPFARGPVAHGDALAEIYAGAAVSLHASCRPPTHQRVFECAVAGGLPAVRWLGAFQASPEALLASEGVWTFGAEPPDLPGARGNVHWEKMLKAWDLWWWVDQPHDRFGYPISGNSSIWVEIADSPSLMARVAEHQRRGETPEWLDGGSARLAPWPMAARVCASVPASDTFGAVLDPGETGFVDASGLEWLVERALERPGWRGGHSRAMADRVRERFSYDGIVELLLGLLAKI
ncbi:MAG: hypothetical protein AAF138_00890 [Planctomycetota bacterium]